jgi:DNA-binding GntR family transcriptional regulator
MVNMNSAPENKVTKQPLGITAYEKIRRKIITLNFKPGEKLEEKQLMHHLKLGRTPIREALLRLVGERLLDSQHGKGFMVRPITLQNTKAVFEMMKILETGAADLAVRQDTTVFLPKIEKAGEDVKKAVKTMNTLRLVQANHNFHLYFAQCAHNEYILRWIDEIRNEAKRLSYLSFTNEIDSGKSLKTHFKAVIQEHDKIITCLKERNEEELKKTILVHIRAFQQRIIAYMSS